MNRSQSFAAAALCGVSVLSTFSLVGCGSGSSSYSQGTGQSVFAGRSYTGTVALAGEQTGAYLLTTAANGTVSGTLTIDDGTGRQAAKQSRVVIATPMLSGTYDQVSGALRLSGSYVFGGRNIPILITGTLPAPPSVSGGTITVITEGQSYTSSFGTAVPATPTPTPSATPTPGAIPSPRPSPSPNPGSTRFSFTAISKSADCNFSDDGFAGLQIKSAKYISSADANLYAFSANLGDSGNRTFLIGWKRFKATGIVPETFTFLPSPAIGAFGDDFQAVLDTAIVVPIGQRSAGAWYPSGGRLIVESVSGSTVRVRGENVEFSPNRFNAISAAGTFTANFTATFENVQGL